MYSQCKFKKKIEIMIEHKHQVLTLFVFEIKKL